MREATEEYKRASEKFEDFKKRREDMKAESYWDMYDDYWKDDIEAYYDLESANDDVEEHGCKCE